MVSSPLGLTLCVGQRHVHVGAELMADPVFVGLLGLCRDWQPWDKAATYLSRQSAGSREQADATLQSLVEAGLLCRRDDATEAKGCRARPRWEARGWADAFDYHWNINHIERVDYHRPVGQRTDNQMMRRYAAAEPVPNNYKDCETSNVVELSRQDLSERRGFDAVWAMPEATVRTPPLEHVELSWFARLAVGEIRKKRLVATGQHVSKTSPSGGARHPTEAYAFIHDVVGVPAGLYHYSVRNHALEELRAGDHLGFVRKHVFCHPDRPAFVPRVTWLFTTVYERSMYRYRESFSYRVLHHDLGHVLETSGLLATSLGRPTYRGYSMNDSKVAEFLGLDDLCEGVLAFVTLG